MNYMATQHLRLRAGKDGYFRACWIDETGQRHQRSFGKVRNIAQNRFAKFFAEWVANPLVRSPQLIARRTIREAWGLYEKHAEKYYRRADGSSTGEAENIALAFEYVLAKFGELSAAEFTPKMLKAARADMVAADLAVNTINRFVGKIRQVFRWFVEEEIVEASVWHAMQAVTPIKAGRGEGRETDPVRPVPEEQVWATVAKLPETLAKMVELQLLTGMRPGELCRMRACDIEADGAVWLYKPGQHKKAHIGRQRTIFLGPKAQEIVKSRLAGRATDAELFSPRDTVRDIGNEPHARIGQRYTKDAYGYAIRRACLKAEVPEWSPNRLRHNAATRLRKEFGLDVAQVVLGHRKADVTQVYAELDLAKAIGVMEKVG